jgi:deoxyribodipyrimidine photo-lyase
MAAPALLWFRRDLRLTDNPALQAALKAGGQVVPLYIHAPAEEAPWPLGGASRWWLHGSLAALDAGLRVLGSRLMIRTGDTLEVLRRVAAETGAETVCWNRLYAPWAVARDSRIKQALRASGLRCESTNASLLFEPWEVTRGAGEPYRVFSAFWRTAARQLEVPAILPAPAELPQVPAEVEGVALDGLELRPRIPWDRGIRSAWTPGEATALEQARAFLAGPVAGYGDERDRPDRDGTSRLSPHLHFGEIGPRQVLALAADAGLDPMEGPAAAFVRELGWREFAHHLLYHFPQTPREPLDPRFADFPWREDPGDQLLAAWQRGRTGVPLVDAGMRQLWETGWMHNRVRMVVASFLTKNLRLPWQAGAEWFWDTLLDADLANNTLGWQWTAGCGADAAPYFRVFNPVRQGERFDPQGDYVRRWCPELAGLRARLIHRPWEAPAEVRAAAGVTLGRDWPAPVVDLSTSREEALAAWGWSGVYWPSGRTRSRRRPCPRSPPGAGGRGP